MPNLRDTWLRAYKKAVGKKSMASLSNKEIYDRLIGSKDLRDCDLKGINLAVVTRDYSSRWKIVGTWFSKSNLEKANLSSWEMVDCEFVEANMSDSSMMQSRMVRNNFDNSCLVDANLTQGSFEFCTFLNADLRHANFSGASLIRADFTGANMQGVNLNKSYMENCMIDDCWAREGNLLVRKVH